MIFLAGPIGAAASCHVTTCQLEHRPPCVRSRHQISKPRSTVSIALINKKKEVTVHGVLPDRVRNMEEVHLVFDVAISQSVAEKRQKSTTIVTTCREMLVQNCHR